MDLVDPGSASAVPNEEPSSNNQPVDTTTLATLIPAIPDNAPNSTSTPSTPTTSASTTLPAGSTHTTRTRSSATQFGTLRRGASVRIRRIADVDDDHERNPPPPVYTNADDDPLLAIPETVRTSAEVTGADHEAPAVVLRSLYPTLPATLDGPIQVTAMVTVSAPPTTTSATSPPPATAIDLVAAVDVSGSMSGSKLRSVRSTLKYLLDALQPADRLSIVKFDDEATVAAPFLRCDDTVGGESLASDSTVVARTTAPRSSRQRLADVADGLRCGAGTAIHKGLSAALDMIAGRQHRNPASAVLLLSDGQDNPHVTRAQYAELVARAAALETTIFTFGYGVDHDATTLLQLAGAAGTFTFVQSESVVRDALAGCVGGVKSTAVRGVKVRLTPLSPWIAPVTGVLCSHEHTLPETARPRRGEAPPGAEGLAEDAPAAEETQMVNKNAVEIKFGDLFADESRDAIVTFTVSSLPAHPDPQNPQASPAVPLLLAECEYVPVVGPAQVGTGAAAEVATQAILSEPLELRFHGGATVRPEGAQPDPAIAQQRLRLMALEAIRGGIAAADAGSTEEARAVMLAGRRRLVEELVALHLPGQGVEAVEASLPPEPVSSDRSQLAYDAEAFAAPTGVGEGAWGTFLAVLEDVDRVAARYSARPEEWFRRGHRMQAYTLLSAYRSQRAVYTPSPVGTLVEGIAEGEEDAGATGRGYSSLLQSTMSRRFQTMSARDGARD
ncbi:hypothetical protein HDU96_002402 [Phlyctochytrium bullatum]|nr:hypothetical protein HDU96_002402 [Phlyctochytrium bullatum]